MEDPLSVTNSEVSEASLRLLVASPVATRLLEDGLFSGSEQGKNMEERTIPFDNIGQTFTLASIIGDNSQIVIALLPVLLFPCSCSVNNTKFTVVFWAGELARSKAAWLSYMVHFGGLTFCLGKKALRIPNLVVAERFGSAILHRCSASLEDVDDAFKALIKDGYIDHIFGLYTRALQQHDVGPHDSKKKEENHCNSMRFTLLANVHPSIRNVGVETFITKV